MAGIYQDKKFWRRKLQSENEGPRTVRPGGRKGCMGSKNDPYPGIYHRQNCRAASGKKTWWDQLKNQRY